jgi:hypothetical protein
LQKALQALEGAAQAEASGNRLRAAPATSAPKARNDSRREHDSASDLENWSK